LRGLPLSWLQSCPRKRLLPVKKKALIPERVTVSTVRIRKETDSAFALSSTKNKPGNKAAVHIDGAASCAQLCSQRRVWREGREQ